MRSIHGAVERVLIRDSDIKEKIGAKLINLSAYAKKIQKDVENLAMKPASVESITVALSRIQSSLAKSAFKNEPLVVSKLSVQAPIIELIYTKNSSTILSLGKTIKFFEKMSSDNFLSLSTSTQDIAILVSEGLAKNVQALYLEKPRIIKKELVALSVRFHESGVSKPNIGTKFMHAIGARRIVLDEVVSTYNEFTIVCHRKYLDDAVDVLNSFQTSSNLTKNTE